MSAVEPGSSSAAALPAAALAEPQQIQIDCWLSAADERSLAEDVLDGLTKPFKELPPKHLYDSRGAELFDQICELPEYYPTRTERAILERDAEAIVAGAVELVELGSGTAAKTRVLLDAMERAERLERYVPIDVTESMIRASAESLIAEYPGLAVHGVVGDFERHLDRMPEPLGPRLLVFLCGTIGNFTPGSRRRFLRNIARMLGPADRLLLGTDLVKDPARLEAAYDDAAGVTAEFNLNVLEVVNRELGGNFELSGFEHVAFYDRRHQWIEMRLRSRRPQRVLIEQLGLSVEFSAGEELRTEISTKFTRERIETDLAASGLELCGWHTDEEELFALSVSQAKAR
ncbi:MAG: L-histidine N(alpha)-methyltransferase [Solirubrobacteraceae bacterium]